jgi:hypothetical protein
VRALYSVLMFLLTGNIVLVPSLVFAAQCNDNSDNDGDGLTDWQYDLGCYGPLDNSEGNTVSGNRDSGWTVFEPSSDTQIIYVSSSQGSDSNNGLSPQNSVQTLAAGKALLRDGHPDWMLLKRGDTWTETFGSWNLSGRSTSEPMVISTFGSSTDRPLLKIGSNTGFTAVVNVNHLALIGIHFYAHTRDPNSPEYVDRSGGSGVRWLAEGQNFLLEDCKFEFTPVVIDCYVYPPDQHPNPRFSDFKMRRSVIAFNYSSGGHAQGIFSSKVDDLLLEENVFDHNGWNVPADRTTFNHNAYITTYNTGLTAKGNIFARGSATGLQARCGGVVNDNLLVQNAGGINYGWYGGDALPTSGGVTGTVRRNVVLDAREISDSGNDAVVAGITLGNIKQAAVEYNLIARKQPTITETAFNLNGSNRCINKDGIDYCWVGINNLTLRNNIAYDFGRPIRIVNSVFSNPIISGNNLQSHEERHLVVDIRDQIDKSQFTLQGNTYYRATGSPNWFRISSGPDTGDYSFNSWITLWGETGASNSPKQFPDPNRSLGSYSGSLGIAATLEAFLTQVRKQSKYNWREEYTAAAVNQYIRAGFDDGTIPADTLSPDAPSQLRLN